MDEQETIVRLRTESLGDASRVGSLQGRYGPGGNFNPAEIIAERILDGCVLIAVKGGRIVGSAALDLDGGALTGLYVAPGVRERGIGRRLVVEIERLAVRFGVTRLHADVPASATGFFRACRYHPGPAGAVEPDASVQPMERKFPQRQTRYGARIRSLLRRIGIPDEYGRMHRLPLMPECAELATIGTDAQGRDQMLLPEAAMAWYALRNAAEEDGIVLEVASAFRSVGYQASIIERKRQAGQSLGEILRVSAAPGFSEHHTGRALDLTTPGSVPLEEEFEATLAFEWLADRAHRHGFRMSYPRHNRHGIAYEPWHWAWTGER